MTTVLDQAKAYVAEATRSGYIVPEYVDQDFLTWTSEFQAYVDARDPEFVAWCSDNSLDVDDQYEFQNPDGVENMNRFEIQVMLYSYYVLTEQALVTAGV